MNPFLTPAEVFDVVNSLAGSVNISIPQDRPVLLMSINKTFVGMLPVNAAPRTQLLLDIGQMNQAGRLANGEIPLEIYLRNAAMFLSEIDPAYEVIRRALDQVTHRSTGAPRLDLARLPEIREAITHTNDMVSIAFMEAGLRAGAAVMQLRTPRFENGQPRLTAGKPVMYNGTGWLLTDSLMMTNHHVINARNEDESAALAPDFQLQANGTLTQMDFDADAVDGIQAGVVGLEAHEATLDYAVLRVQAVAGRDPLRRASAAIVKDDPVNIIQHPYGKSKKYAIRNNLVSAVEGNDVRYFTDTDGGSSGSPVLNDRWEVVALHRGATYVSNVQFQGKKTAYINLGTSLPAILTDLKTRNPALSAEIGL